jgi:hypothetical protein
MRRWWGNDEMNAVRVVRIPYPSQKREGWGTRLVGQSSYGKFDAGLWNEAAARR